MAAIKAGVGGLTWLNNSRRLRELESLYTAINKSQAVIELDMAGTVLTANDSYLKMFGYTLAEILGKPYTVFVNPADREAAEYRTLWEQRFDRLDDYLKTVTAKKKSKGKSYARKK